MVEHIKSADQIVAEAIAAHIDTEGIFAYEMEAIENAIYWALEQVGVM